VLHAFLQRLIRVGRLTVRLPGGRVHAYGDGSGPEVVLAMTARGARMIVLHPDPGLGEAYMSGDVVLERGDIWDLMEIVGRNQAMNEPSRKGPLHAMVKAARRRLEQWNDRNAALRNAAHHYDLSVDLYRRFLDADLQYTCAYFARPDMTLEEAQAAKKAHLAAKLRLQPGMKVLDIGCGWGGLALELARTHGVEVLGVTLSREQLAVARDRAEAAGVAGRVTFSLTDFRDVQGPFDRIVSVGMFEAVGVPAFPAYFGTLRRLLTDDGIALIHSIGRRTPPSTTSPWTRKYIFPGGYIPALSETLAAVEAEGLWVTDIEILRLHYAETLRHWRQRFTAEREAVARLYDERFCRMWEFYLASAELAFRYGDQMNFQIQLTKAVDALPITRDYMLDAERAPPSHPKAWAAE
jgi:cyclopropane-fatty-acyl-phospholipid synthase